MNQPLYKKLRSQSLAAYFVASLVLLDGLLVIIVTLVQQLVMKDLRSSIYQIELTLFIGITFVYLSNLLWRRKQMAWVVTLIVYAFYIGVNLNNLATLSHRHFHHLHYFLIIKSFVIPVLAVIGLIYSRNVYKVKSDTRSFGVSLRIIFIVLLIALFYGVTGFLLMDKADFHHEIDVAEALHRTIDQFGFTTNSHIIPYTKRARLFLDSLNFISVAAVVFAFLSLFQPLKARFGDQTKNREIAESILADHHGNSEDFFKVWPHDKNYFFNQTFNAGLAYAVRHGVALVAGDPFGAVSEFSSLIGEFEEFCKINDWRPSFIHIAAHYIPLYEEHDYSIQKIGEEPVVETDHFIKNVVTNKYFRNINNKFQKQGYSYEVLKPPHAKDLIFRLREVSNEWLKLPGRAERTFMLGYFTEAYLQKCNLLVLRDSAGTIQGFINEIPSYDRDEANYDMMRHTKHTLGNSSDYMMTCFIKYQHERGMKRVNLGLCPLVGLDKADGKEKTIVDSALNFLYANGDRLYSFSGLYKYKLKYEPKWDGRYIAYKGGIPKLTRTANALNSALKPHRIHLK